jgi:hypothetical protein
MVKEREWHREEGGLDMYLSSAFDVLGVAADEGGLLLLVGRRHCVCVYV